MFVLLISNRLESNSGRLRNQFLSLYNNSSLAIFPVASTIHTYANRIISLESSSLESTTHNRIY